MITKIIVIFVLIIAVITYPGYDMRSATDAPEPKEERCDTK